MAAPRPCTYSSPLALNPKAFGTCQHLPVSVHSVPHFPAYCFGFVRKTYQTQQLNALQNWLDTIDHSRMCSTRLRFSLFGHTLGTFECAATVFVQIDSTAAATCWSSLLVQVMI
jgi:hypothetical protein